MNRNRREADSRMSRHLDLTRCKQQVNDYLISSFGKFGRVTPLTRTDRDRVQLEPW